MTVGSSTTHGKRKMATFEVKDMSGGQCVSDITKAVLAIDPSVKVTADLATHQVRIDATGSGATELMAAIRGAGYSPVPVDDRPVLSAQSAPRSGCCCR
jgi:copper chaperone